MVEAEIPKTVHLDRGLYGWYQADLPFTGDYKPDIGRTPRCVWQYEKHVSGGDVGGSRGGRRPSLMGNYKEWHRAHTKVHVAARARMIVGNGNMCVGGMLVEAEEAGALSLMGDYKKWGGLF